MIADCRLRMAALDPFAIRNPKPEIRNPTEVQYDPN